MKLLYSLFSVFLLISCSSTPEGMDKDLYDAGKEIIVMTSENMKSDVAELSNEQKGKMDTFDSKYTDNLDNMNEKEAEFIKLVRWSYRNYWQYSHEKDTSFLDDYNKYIGELEAKFNMDVD